VVTLTAYLPYIRGILQGRTRPHVFSWVIWGATTTIVFVVQLAAGGGAGAWAIGVSGMITIFIAILAYIHRSDNSISRIDWLFFIAALSSLPFWYLTSNPLWSVIILTTVDMLGFGPTLRKAYFYPFQEQSSFFALFMLNYILVMFSLEIRSWTTMLFPAALALACLVMTVMIHYRRRKLAAETHPRV